MTLTASDPLLDGSPYQGYSYAYPHKTAYRPFPRPLPLRELWAGERRDALFLYVHVPFCEMRCGFCNLFTQARPGTALMDDYLIALGRQVEQVRAALGDAAFARLAVGGGTPTALDVKGLAGLLDLAARLLGSSAGRIPASVETSPETAEFAKLVLLRQHGVTRISLGVQSFLEAETAAVGRPQKSAAVLSALDCIRAQGFPVLNIDLIYGLPGQTVASWLDSVQAALRFRPEELYLYPLYVRPLTGLGRSGRSWDDHRLACYREARDLLRTEGYRQVSMRLFRAGHCPVEDGPVYCCQDDGMVGLGCGARSYTRSVHYSGPYAIRAQGVREIIADYIAQPTEAFAVADHGFRLDTDEQRRRYVLQSLLLVDGLSLPTYRGRFGTDARTDLPQLTELEPRGLARAAEDRLALTDAGLERSDAIGPWLYSPAVRALMEGYKWH
ncbi:MAG TPA: STM4012 family radical SAM protein [Gemmataceae bacterium]|jgi:oxygen-independent coproporphyrinogen-3 oxidase